MNEYIIMDQWDSKIRVCINANSQDSVKRILHDFITEIRNEFEFVFFDEDEISNFQGTELELSITVLGSVFAAEDIKNKILHKQNENISIDFSSDYDYLGTVRMPINDKKLFEGWLKINQRIANGRNYNILKNYSAVTALVINENHEVLLVKQFRPSIMTITYELPAGCLDIVGEDPAETMVRELREETSLSLSKTRLQKLITYYSALGHSSSQNTVFYASVAKAEVDISKIKDEDVLGAIWMPFSEFEKQIQSGNIIDSKTVIGYYHYKTFIESKTDIQY